MTEAATLQADEKLALDLMAAIRSAAEKLVAPEAVDLVSVTMDVSARVDTPGTPGFDTRIDRRTRTILFAGGSASVGGTVVMTATAVYSIRPA
ncbi:MAG TPA: hypothetical protein PK417_01285 [Hyphomonas sp.]|nr:hypothetical protein [Hyphomonas sp.]HRX72543.1 hypothetical protein [Hyphomonas sp.]